MLGYVQIYSQYAVVHLTCIGLIDAKFIALGLRVVPSKSYWVATTVIMSQITSVYVDIKSKFSKKSLAILF